MGSTPWAKKNAGASNYSRRVTSHDIHHGKNVNYP